MKNQVSLITNISICSLFVFLSCTREQPADPNLSLINQMKAVTDSIIQNTHVPSIVALVVDKKLGIDWLYTTGYSDIPHKLPMDPNNTFRVGSATKTMSVTLLLQLVDEGKVELTDKLSKYFPEYARSDSITIASLCNMSSGIYEYLHCKPFQAAMEANHSKVWLPGELVEIGLSHEFYFSPSDYNWHYSSTNTLIIGQIVELITGNTLETEINNRIIKPLNLSRTGFLTSGLTFPGPHGKGYYEGTYLENNEMTEVFDISWAWAAGSAYSCPRELQKYAEALVDGKYLSETLQKTRLNEYILPLSLDYKEGYGLGIWKHGSFYGHPGTLMGFTTAMYHSIEKECTVIIYFNCDVELQPDYLFYRFMKILYNNNY